MQRPPRYTCAMYARLFIIACALLAASEAGAQRPPRTGPPPQWTQVNWPVPPIRWSCVEPGFREVELGARACLRTAEGWRVATCTLVFNMTNWEIGRESCRGETVPER